jgi:sulfatase modifying factor 1
VRQPIADTPAIVKRALVVAVSNYENANALPETINDAHLIVEMLHTQLGFPREAIVLMTDESGTPERLRPTHSHLVAQRDALLNGINEQSEVVVFFSGHGTRFGDHDFLMPSDGAPGSIKETCLDYDEFKARLKTRNPARALLIVDACRELSGKGDESGVGGSKVELGPQIAELLSCQPKEVSQIGKPEDFPESVFTHFLLQGLKGDAEAVNEQGLVTFDRLKQYVRSQVSRYVQQKFSASQNPDGNTTLGSMVLTRVEASSRRASPHVPTRSTLERGVMISRSAPRLDAKYGLELMEIPAGEFTMGTTEEEVNTILASNPKEKRESFAGEMPQHPVYLDTYYIGKTPVTVGQYKQFCRATNRQMPPAPDFNPNWSKADHPIVYVSWNDAMAYCAWLSGETGYTVKLPTEAQWEKAARGSDGRKYPWGDNFDRSRLQCSMHQHMDAGGTSAVGSFPSGVSPYGVLDMAGNVYQWCSDWYDENYYGNTPKNNPFGPSSGQERVLRGGSWYGCLGAWFRCALRFHLTPDNKNYYFGFRCVVLPH